MRVIGLVAAVAVAEQTLKAEPPYVWEVVKPTLMSRMGRPTRTRKELSAAARAKRTPDNCKFALDVVILQDATDSFSDNFSAMKDVQLDLVYNGIMAAHPESKFGMVSFKDKPIWPLGDRDDYCTQYDAPLSAGIGNVKKAYGSILSYGGADAPENQLGTLYNVLGSNHVNWTQSAEAVKLVVISTDAGPHFGGDSRSYMLPPFNPQAFNDDTMSVCTSNYYPTLEQVKGVVEYNEAYVAALVYDGEWAAGWPSKSWIAFNEFIGQSPEFVAAQAPDSSDFWYKLANVIRKIEDETCVEPEIDTTTTAPTTPATTTIATVPTTYPPSTTTAPTATATTTTTAAPTTTRTAPIATTAPPSVTSSSITTTQHNNTSHCECPCPPHKPHCECCPEVVVAIMHRPSMLNLTFENKFK